MPFYFSDSLLDHKFDVVDSILDSNQVKLVANPYFYLTQQKLSGKIVNFETHHFINKDLNLSRKSIELKRLEFPGNRLRYSKYLDIPYTYWYDLLFKLRYIPKFKLKKKHLRSVKKTVTTYGIQVRLKHWKHLPERNKDREFVYDLYENLIKNIASNDHRHRILYYGDTDDRIDEIFNNYNSININKEYDTLLERAYALSDSKYSFGSACGFSYFSNYLAISRNNLKNKFLINDTSKLYNCFHVRRLFGTGINETHLGSNGGYYISFKYLTEDKVLYDFKKELKHT